MSTVTAKRLRAFWGAALTMAACSEVSTSNPASEGTPVAPTWPPAIVSPPSGTEPAVPEPLGDPGASLDSGAPVAPTLPKGPNAALATLPHGEAQRVRLCELASEQKRADRIVDAFCGDEPAEVRSLAQLQDALNIDFDDDGTDPAFALNGHTASLTARGTSAINPRAILMSDFGATNSLALAYARGEQAVELIALDRTSNKFAFYLAVYEQPCNQNGACSPADLLTPATESDWSQLSIYPREDIANTIFDCDTCHMARNEDGSTRRFMRMQELRNPWTHWFRDNTAGGTALLADYRAAHGTKEAYAGIPGARIGGSEPAALQLFVNLLGSGAQPNEFPTGTIEFEVATSATGQPRNNSTPGTSATWSALQKRFLEGKAIPAPYHDVKVTDGKRLAEMTAAYQAFAAGERADLPDIRDVFRQDRLHEIAGIRLPDELDGQELLVAACAQCHNDKLDQTLSRARFNIDATQYSDQRGGVLTGPERDSEIALAMNRLSLPEGDVRLMPPSRLRELSESQRAKLRRYLCSLMESPSSECTGL